MTAIDPRWITNLKGRDYPTWPGALDAAHRSGRLSIATELIQIPGPENDQTAIVKANATLETAEGTQTFSDYGDANPGNVARHLTGALIRMASTRAKGRALRDLINCGQALLEGMEDEGDGKGVLGAEVPSRRNPAPSTQNPAPPATERRQAEARLAQLIQEAERRGILDQLPSATRYLDMAVGDLTQQELVHNIGELEATLRCYPTAAPPAPAGDHPNLCESCGTPLPPARVTLSRQKFGATYCIKHQPAPKAA